MGGAWFWEEGGAASGREGCNEMRFHSSVSTVYVNHIFAVLPLFINQFANYHPGPILLIAPYAPKVPHDKEQRKVLDTDIKKQLLTREVKRIKLETKDRKKLEKKNAGRGRGYASSWQL